MFWQVTLDTRNFSFEAYGETKDDATFAIGQLLSQHARQYNLGSGWHKTFFDELTYRELGFNRGYRDRQEIENKSCFSGLNIHTPKVD